LGWTGRDVGEGGDIQLIAVGRVNAAGHVDGDGSRGCLDIVGQWGVVGRPVHKVDQVDAELGGVRVDRVPGQRIGVALGQSCVRSGAGELDGGDEGRRKGEE